MLLITNSSIWCLRNKVFAKLLETLKYLTLREIDLSRSLNMLKVKSDATTSLPKTDFLLFFNIGILEIYGFEIWGTFNLTFQESPNFTPFRSMTSCFRDTGLFKTNALNNPKITVQGWMYSICVTGVLESHISGLFTTASHFRVTSHFETKALNDPKWLWNITRS